MAAIWWVTTIGFILCLGFVVGTLVHFLRSSLNLEDSSRIDPIRVDKED